MGALSLTTQFTNFYYLSGTSMWTPHKPQVKSFGKISLLDRLALVGLRSGIGGWNPVVGPGWNPVRGPPWNPVLDSVEVLLKMHSPKLNLPQRRRIYTPYIIIYMPHLLIIYLVPLDSQCSLSCSFFNSMVNL